MIAWWTSLSLFMKILWGITLVASLIFVIQSVLTFIGADADAGGIDADFDVSGGDISDADADAPSMSTMTGSSVSTGSALVLYSLTKRSSLPLRD